MPPSEARQDPDQDPKRRVLMLILVLAWAGSCVAWASIEARGQSSPVLRAVFGLNLLFHPAAFLVAWRRLRPLRVVELACLLFAAGICAACMALRLYSPVHGARIDIQPLYLWIPVIHVFVFTLAGHRSSLRISLWILAGFVAISAPHLVLAFDQATANFTVQMHVVCAVLIAALHFFAGYQRRLQMAQLSADAFARLAYTDPLTELPNRRRVLETIESEFQRLRRFSHVFSIILIDADHFKAVNDEQGHSEGDHTLVALAARMRTGLRDVDTLGRWGGEEFIVVLPESGFDAAQAMAKRLCRHVAGQPLVGGRMLTISCGVTTATAEDSADSILRRADSAMYQAKAGGRNRAEGVATEEAMSVQPPASSLARDSDLQLAPGPP